jgi:hypothetical protein
MGTDRDIEAHGCLLWERTLEGLRRSAPPSTKRLPSTGERSDRLN